MKGFEVGRTYNRRRDLHERFGGQRQGGISTPTGQTFIWLFTGESGEQYGYKDGWNENGVFVYTGEGQKGDMKFVRGNLAIREHAQERKSLALFQSLGKGRDYRYLGEFVCETYDYRRGPDVEENDRRVIVFHLVRIEDTNVPSFEPTEHSSVSVESIDSLRKIAYKAASSASEVKEVDAKRVVYERSEAVRQYVLARANGKCESCRKDAPFRRGNGMAYLEPHHIRRVSDGGPDHPRSVAAVCPNCHREIHSGEHGRMKNEDLANRVLEIESRGQD